MEMVLGDSWLFLTRVILIVCCMASLLYARPGASKIDILITEYDNYTRCTQGKLEEDGTCTCNPCWDGPTCDIYVDNYSPRFLIHAATTVIPVNVTGTVYRAWSTDEDLGLTCPLGPGESARCPCATVSYELFAPPGDHRFKLDPVTGILSRDASTPIQTTATYTYKLMVQGIPVTGHTHELLYDLMDLRIYVSGSYVRKIPWT